MFLSTHSLDIAEELADRIGIVEHGRLIACGTLAALRKQAALDGSLEEVFLKLTQEAAAELPPERDGAAAPPDDAGTPNLQTRDAAP